MFIFSGIIRNYFLDIKDFRDIDIVLDGTLDIKSYLDEKNFNYTINNFKGYKIFIDDIAVDLWFLKDTWAFNHPQKMFENFEMPQIMPRTAFFNFSSIIFSFNKNEFYYTKDFTRFLRDKKIDMVFEHNPNNALCLVNSFYYSDKLNLRLGERLKKHLKKISNDCIDRAEEIQISHFGKVLYPNDKIKIRLKEL